MQPFAVLMAKLHDVPVKVSEARGGTAVVSAAKRSALLLVKVLSPEGAQNGSMRRANFWKPRRSLLNLRVSEALGRLASHDDRDVGCCRDETMWLREGRLVKDSGKVWKIVGTVIVWVTLIIGLVMNFKMHMAVQSVEVMLLGALIGDIVNRRAGGSVVDRLTAESQASAQADAQGRVQRDAQEKQAQGQLKLAHSQASTWRIVLWVVLAVLAVVGVVLLCMHLSDAAMFAFAAGFAIFAVASLIETVRA